MFAKLVLRYAAFYKACGSLALGRNPRLIAGYMAELQPPQTLVPAASPPVVPALIVMGEAKVQVEQQPHGGLSLKHMPSSSQADRRRGLVTLDRVWEHQSTLLDVAHKDLCLSFALFKMLRCRFAKYTVSEASFIKASKFFREALLQGEGEGDHHHYERVFGVITDELSFINDYYYSPLPIYYSHPLLPALGITLSLWAIGYCLFLSVGFAILFVLFRPNGNQITCEPTLPPGGANDDPPELDLGSVYYDLVLLYLVLAVLVLSETREIASYICSKWTKLALIYHRINQAWWQRPRLVQRCVSCLLEYRRCKLLRNNWDDNTRQCSVLAILPRNPRRSRTPHLLLRRLLRLPEMQKKVKVPTAVKAAIFEAIKGLVSCCSSEHGNDDRAHGGWRIRPPPPPVPVSQQLLHACSPACSTILVWHIATSVFEASQQLQAPSTDDHKIVATHLSCYCAYLVSSCPELLPDDAEWCRGLYGEVKKNADRVLAELQQGYSHGQLVEALMMSAADDGSSGHEVLRNGAALGKELVESKMGWEALARFWSRMVLYVAPSENLEAHAESISHGGELITLLWALLAHAGIVDRVDVDDADAAVAAAAEDQDEGDVDEVTSSMKCRRGK